MEDLSRVHQKNQKALIEKEGRKEHVNTVKKAIERKKKGMEDRERKIKERKEGKKLDEMEIERNNGIQK